MSAETTPLERATEAVQQRSTWPSLHWGMKTVLHREAAAALSRAALDAAFDDPDLGNRIRDWRLTPCEHSRPLRYGPDLSRSAGQREQACSSCLRDRLRAWLGGAS